jgi:predicted DNA-binding transcriptional regulator AlpA
VHSKHIQHHDLSNKAERHVQNGLEPSRTGLLIARRWEWLASFGRSEIAQAECIVAFINRRKIGMRKTDEPDDRPEASLPPLCRTKLVLSVVPCARSTLWLWVRQGRFPKPIKYGGMTLWKRDDLLAWIAKAGGQP